MRALRTASVLLLALWPVATMAQTTAPWSENFDSYTTFSTIAGQGGWATWDSSTDPAVDAQVSDAQSSSVPHSLFVGGTADVVQQFTGVTSGAWVFSTNVYVPTGLTGSAYFILLNEYQDLGPYNWSVQVEMNGTTGMVNDLGGSAGGPGAAGTAPLILDQWVEIRVEIDLDANTHSVYYDGVALRTNEIYSGASMAIACLDLYSASSSGVYFDDVSLVEAPCTAPTGLACTSNCGSDTATASWFLSGTPYDSIEILIDGTSAAMLPGDATQYMATGLSDGAHTIEVLATCAGGAAFPLSCDVVIASTPPTHIVWAAEGGGLVDSASAIVAALDNQGITALVTTDLSLVDCIEEGAVLFCCLGTYPTNHPLTADEGQRLADLVTDGVHIHLEGGDIWGFDAATVFTSYDGVADGAIDGDDTLLGLIGFDYGPALMGGLTAVYMQDQAGSDWTDQITPATTDLAGPDAGVIWVDDLTGGGSGYTVGIFYDTAPDFGRVVSQSFEFGGFGGSHDELIMRELDAFTGTAVPVDEFRRGDANGDGGFDISDAVFTLGSLFVPGSPSPGCSDAADANDDGTVDISDAVFELGALFVPGSPPPPAPGILDCGPDPTMDTLTCDTTPCP